VAAVSETTSYVFVSVGALFYGIFEMFAKSQYDSELSARFAYIPYCISESNIL
jgi:hypothetical protein